MATTYEAISTTDLSGLSTITIGSIPATYTDLRVVITGSIATGTQNLQLQINGDTGANYGRTFMGANGSGYDTDKESNYTYITCDRYAYMSTNNNNFILDFNSYANSAYKSILIRGSNGATGISIVTAVWKSTAAITSLTFFPTGSTWTSGSSVTIYGIASTSALATTKATGGDIITTYNGYTYHAFLSSGTFTPSQALTADYLVVAGGGSGGNFGGAGGGAGGLLAVTSQSISTAQTVTIGAGGAGVVPSTFRGNSGSNSVFGSSTATGGGGGGSTPDSGNGRAGGSGGGAGGGAGGPGTGVGGTGVSGQGFAGGNAAGAGGSGGSGGGGAGAVGANGTSSETGGNGGNGSNAYSTWASATGTGANSGYYAGGGGGGTGTGVGGGSGGLGGGTGGHSGTDATPNTGGGGGGRWNSGTSSAGGSGLVIVRYAV